MKVLVKGLVGAVALAGFSLPAYADTTLTIAHRQQRQYDRYAKADG